MCACGCRGWCTLFPLLMVLAVDLLACAMGGYVHVPNELLTFGVDVDKYSVLAFMIAVVEMRTDWPAWCEVIGVRTWAHARFPCPKCNCPLSKMVVAPCTSQITLENGPWEKYGQEEYLADVRRSTIVVWRMLIVCVLLHTHVLAQHDCCHCVYPSARCLVCYVHGHLFGRL